MIKRFLLAITSLLLALAILAAPAATRPLPARASQPQEIEADSGAASANAAGLRSSHRLIVQLDSAPLVAYIATSGGAASVMPDGKPNFESVQAQAYLSRLEAEQAAFISQMASALPSASVSHYINEFGAAVDLTYQVTFNGMTIDPGPLGKEAAARVLSSLPGVKNVFYDYARQPDLYASTGLINVSAIWNSLAIGGMDNAGEGIKFATMDGGAHHDAPMFDGTGYSYPADYPAGGLGLTANNNGKIILSRAYFRSWDPPSAGDENPWPGTQGTSHGVHTASTAAGNAVIASYQGITQTLSGVAPRAWVMSYRVFYNSITNDGSFYNAEGLAALEDILRDGADVLNNSWGGGPGSAGGEFDPLDLALINVAAAGTFVSMSAGNAGPYNGTSDHPSPQYISVAASTSGGTFSSGRMNASAPEPVDPALQNIAMSFASFGGTLAVGGQYTYSYLPSAAANPANIEGCSAWPAGTFTGKIALIRRGTCEFGVKALNAQNAGASVVVIYNQAANGNTLTTMGAGAVGSQVTIPAYLIGNTNGEGLVAWYGTHGAAAQITLDMIAYQVGNTPDFIASFSSRGPGVGGTLKPDITAPGVNILAQGYTAGETGEARHLGWGQASGTSMASPHVAGAAILLRQVHPDWPNSYIKSALMSTSKYIGVWTHTNAHAQPLDMGAGRLDLTHAANPGVIFDTPSFSGGQVIAGEVITRTIMVTSVAGTAETYALSAVSVTGTYPDPVVGALAGFSVSPASLTLAPGETGKLTITFDSTLGVIGDNQGHIVLDGAAFDAHLPAWVRVGPTPTADILVIDNDASFTLGKKNYLSYYTQALDTLGLTYTVRDADANYNKESSLFDAAVLSSYKAILLFTGDNYQPNGTFSVRTPLTPQDMTRLTEYANSGGILIAMGQDLSSVTGAPAAPPFFYSYVLGGDYLRDSVTNNTLPSLPITADPAGPAAMQAVSLNLAGPVSKTVTLTGAAEVPPVATTASGTATFAYNQVTRQLDYSVTINAPAGIDLTAMHIHTGAAGVNGPVIHTLLDVPVTFTGSQTFTGNVTIDVANVSALLSGGLYINAHSAVNPAGEVRAQVQAGLNGDGAGNQKYIDELNSRPNVDPQTGSNDFNYTSLLRYAGSGNIDQGTVAIAHRDQPTLENPGIDYFGRSIYASFGLEGVNDGLGGTSRATLLKAFLDWAEDVPEAAISDITTDNESNLTTFRAALSSPVTGTVPVSYRWDFGDGTAYTGSLASRDVSHVYAYCGVYTVRVEITDSWGNKALASSTTRVSQCTAYPPLYLPVIQKP